MNIVQVLKEKREEIIEIASKYGASHIEIIGSVARGEVHSESDIDLLIDLEPGRTLLEHGSLMFELEKLLGCKVDIAVRRGLRNRVRERVEREAVPL